MSGTPQTAVSEPLPPGKGVPVSDVRERLASLTMERNELAEEIGRLQSQRNVWALLCGVLFLGIGWLSWRELRKASPRQTAQDPLSDTPFGDQESEKPAVETAVTVRKNATITIRNGTTQREEVIDSVQTRRYFAAPTPASDAESSRRSTRKFKTETVTPEPSSDSNATEAALEPSTTRKPKSPRTDSSVSTARQERHPQTVRVTQQSDRQESVEVSVKPGTTGIFRRQAFTLLEVMISLAILATVLASVSASIYTLHQTRQLAQEQAEATELGHLFAERILAEPHWGALNSNTLGNMWITSYAPTPGVANSGSGTPLTAAALITNQVVQRAPALNNLAIYLERYSLGALDAEAKDSTTHIFKSASALNPHRNFYGSLYRIVIQWDGIDGSKRSHHQFIARQGDF